MTTMRGVVDRQRRGGRIIIMTFRCYPTVIVRRPGGRDMDTDLGLIYIWRVTVLYQLYPHESIVGRWLGAGDEEDC
jgi:hypothetical protein